MTCQHPNAHPELPCPWPDCPAGTPQQAIALLLGEMGEIRARHGHSMTVESEAGVQLWRRRQQADAWEWILQGG